ncbi:MAG TPA: PEP-CTERM sorting domain-containing protein [Lacipirellulaceae bacterium]|nr:PEP-CTERM sorting domain-containing protein [Lacipirellulaceae bacterium]
MMGTKLGAAAVRRPLVVGLALVVIVSCVAGKAIADDDDIVNANGFELPFTTVFAGTGQLEGQVNPPGEGQILAPGQWQRTPGGTSTAVVQSAVFAPGGGTQAVKVDRAANNDVRWAVQVDHLGYPDYPNPFPPEPAQPCICINWDMRVQQTQGPEGTFGPFFGVEAYDDSGTIGLLGSLGVDARTGEVLYQATGTGFLTPTGTDVNFGEWNRFQIKLDYSTDQYTIFQNFAMLGTFGFVDPGLDQFSDADISAIAAAGEAASQALTGTAYFDNFLVREGACPIPEPATLALIGFGLAGASLGARRNRQGQR